MNEIFHKINKSYDDNYLTYFWHIKQKKLVEAINILYETIIIHSDDGYLLFRNLLKYYRHIKMYEKTTGKKIVRIKNIIEWGGGFGGMARIIKKINPECTYIIIDLPAMICWQYYYLKNAHLIDSEKIEIKEGKINLLPLPFISKFNYNPDMFISTWGISESGFKAIKYVRKKKWFNSENLLITQSKKKSFQFPNRGMRIENAKIVEIDKLNKYIIR